MKKLIIYHNEDNDGLFSAAIAARFEESFADSIEYLGLTYADQKAIVSGTPDAKMPWFHILHYFDRVIMVDFSFPVEKLKELAEAYSAREGFVWIDHHAPIIAAVKEAGLDDKIPGIRDTGHSAIYSIWKWYEDLGIADQPLPELLNLLQLWDSWTYDESNREIVTQVNIGVTATCELNLAKTREFLETEVMDPNKMPLTIARMDYFGSVLLAEQTRKNTQIIERSGDCTFTAGPDNDKTCLIVYSDGTGSRNFASLKGTDVIHGAVLRRLKTGTWNISLYNIEDSTEFHCGAYLRKEYGGGGHQGAGGAELTWEQALKILETKHI